MFDCYDTLITPEEVADMLGFHQGNGQEVLCSLQRPLQGGRV